MIKVLFIRHGATVGNLEKRYIGRTDEPLCKEGVKQVLRLREQDFKVNYLFVSPMLRTRQTAELLFPGMTYAVVNDFAETDFGMFEGKTAAELSGCQEYQAWVDSMCLAPIPDGESVTNFKMRCCKAFLAAMKTVPKDTCVAFVVHGGVIMSILEAYAKPARKFYDYYVENGKYWVCCHNQKQCGDICLKMLP